MANPVASAPILYGSQAANSELLPWDWAYMRLVAAKNYWIATTRPDGRPHTRPVWGIWLDDSLWFSTGSLARHNLAANGAISAHLEDGDSALIIEGHADAELDQAALQRMCDLYGPKYDWPLYPTADGVRDDNNALGPVFRVYPEVIFGWDVGMASPTRWQFPSG